MRRGGWTVNSWGGDHPDGPDPSRASLIAGLVLLALAAAAVLVVSVLYVAGLVQV